MKEHIILAELEKIRPRKHDIVFYFSFGVLFIFYEIFMYHAFSPAALIFCGCIFIMGIEKLKLYYKIRKIFKLVYSQNSESTAMSETT